jgi:hypothetical protein
MDDDDSTKALLAKLIEGEHVINDGIVRCRRLFGGTSHINAAII